MEALFSFVSQCASVFVQCCLKCSLLVGVLKQILCVCVCVHVTLGSCHVTILVNADMFQKRGLGESNTRCYSDLNTRFCV